MLDLAKWSLDRDQYNILLESSDFDCEFRELFLQLRYEDNTDSIEMLFSKLLRDIRLLLERKLIQTVLVEYEEIKPKHYKTKVRNKLNLNEAFEALEKPSLWLYDSLDNVDSLVLSTTSDGELLLDEILGYEERME